MPSNQMEWLGGKRSLVLAFHSQCTQIISLDELSDYTFGELVFFFWKSLAISGYLLGINPFNQPGVEDYKKNMFALLGKPGYEDMRTNLEKRLNAVL